jgi:hypothetical protein
LAWTAGRRARTLVAGRLALTLTLGLAPCLFGWAWAADLDRAALVRTCVFRLRWMRIIGWSGLLQRPHVLAHCLRTRFAGSFAVHKPLAT